MNRAKISFTRYGATIKKLLIPIAIAVAVIAGAIFITNSGIGQNGKVISYGADSKAAFRVYDSGFMQYTKDGVTYFGSSGDKSWTDSYTMTSPVAMERGDYTAIFETGGRNVRVYNESGLVCNIQTSDTVTSVSLAENGYTGVLTSGSSYMVTVYNTSGNMLFQRVEAESGTYPMCCDISSDGRIVAISYIDTSGVSIKTKIGMFYISAEEGADYTDSMFAAVSKDNEIVFKMYFMSNGTLIAIGDRSISCISAAGVEESTVEVTNEITGVGLCGNKIAIAYGDEMSDKEGQEKGTIMFVSSNGKVSAGYCIGQETDYFVTSKGGVVAGSGTSFYGIDSSGNMQWNLNTSGNVTGIYPTNNVKVCIYATRTWAVRENMVGFDTMEYDPNVLKATGGSEDGTSGENQVETVTDETTVETVTGTEDVQGSETQATGETQETQETQDTQGTEETQETQENNTAQTENSSAQSAGEEAGAANTGDQTNE